MRKRMRSVILSEKTDIFPPCLILRRPVMEKARMAGMLPNMCWRRRITRNVFSILSRRSERQGWFPILLRTTMSQEASVTTFSRKTDVWIPRNFWLVCTFFWEEFLLSIRVRRSGWRTWISLPWSRLTISVPLTNIRLPWMRAAQRKKHFRQHLLFPEIMQELRCSGIRKKMPVLQQGYLGLK